MRRLTLLRRVSQLFFFGLFVYILWSTTFPLQGGLPPETFFQADPLIMGAAAISARLILPGMGWAIMLVLATLLLGRFFCGWVCPLGTTIDIAGHKRLRQGMPAPGRMRRLAAVKFVVLGFILLLALFGIQAAWLMDPVVIIGRFVSLNFIPSFTLGLETLFILLIRGFHFYGPVLDVYRDLQASLLGVKVYYFSNAAFIFVGFLIAAGSAVFIPRFWCRSLCPLGALYALISRAARLRRTVDGCVFCGRCKNSCRMGAIRQDAGYDKQECVLCMDCIYVCPQQVTRFRFFERSGNPAPRSVAESGISRRSFLTLVAVGAGALVTGIRRRSRAINDNVVLIRPPQALAEPDFLNRCIRCGNCMKVCPTNGLQPVLFAPNLDSLWTPQLVPEIGYCEYSCTLCADVCPTGAIPRTSLIKKQKAKLGIAKIDKNLCLPFAEKKSCIVCEEHCPIPEKAIKSKIEIVDGLSLIRPYVDEELCIGCGICQTKCPIRPVRAIKILPVKSDRTRVGSDRGKNGSP